jgi:hypothetical protein
MGMQSVSPFYFLGLYQLIIYLMFFAPLSVVYSQDHSHP